MIVGNIIGLDPTGLIAVGNQANGVYVENGVTGTTKMWLDKKTLLPFRVEYELPKLKLWYTMSDFEWMDNWKTLTTCFECRHLRDMH